MVYNLFLPSPLTVQRVSYHISKTYEVKRKCEFWVEYVDGHFWPLHNEGGGQSNSQYSLQEGYKTIQVLFSELLFSM
jgi:hypothetical protein